MPRPRKCRKVCQMPSTQGFAPIGAMPDASAVTLTVDEYEAVRLIDKEGFSQEACGSYMNIARTTVQQIYTSARKKIADALVDGLILRIEGGDYQLCSGEEDYCGCGGCQKHRQHRCCLSQQEEKPMKIAIPLDENQQDVCITFARAPYFLFSENGSTEILDNPAAEASGGAGLQAAQFLLDQHADVLITVRCGQNAADVFKAADLKVYQADGTDAQANLTALIEGKLARLTHFHAGFHGIQ